MSLREMICTCSAEGVYEVEQRRLRIFKRMNLDDMGDLTTAIILSLAFDFQADASIAADMWFGVSLRSPLLADERFAELGYVYQGQRYLNIECDWPGDGLAWLWEQLAEKYPERVSVRQGTPERNVRIMTRISSGLFSNYDSAWTLYRGHRVQAHKDDNDCPPCEDCDVYRSLFVTAHHTLDEAWGGRDLDKAIEKAFEE